LGSFFIIVIISAISLIAPTRYEGNEIEAGRNLPEHGGKSGQSGFVQNRALSPLTLGIVQLKTKALSDGLSPGNASLHMLQFHHIWRPDELFHTPLISSQ
jgi:hypothetical protein